MRPYAIHGFGRMTFPWLEPTRRVRPKKRLGQHFLINRGVLRKIVEAAQLTAQDTVVEVGPGTGFLTQELAVHAGNLIAVELDRDLAARLREEMEDHPNVRIIQGDILDWPPERLLGPVGAAAGGYKVVANLPYYITAPVLRHFLADARRPQSLVAMIQHEVARSLVAAPGHLGLLAVAVRFYGRVEFIASVAPGSFQPPPKVRSAIVRIVTHAAPPVAVPSPEAFFETVRAGFSARRKQLRNALAQGLAIPAADAARLLNASDLDPHRRAETLDLEEWARLTRVRHSAE